MKLDNEAIRTAAKEWLENSKEAEENTVIFQLGCK